MLASASEKQEACIFCQIIAREAPAFILAEDDHIIVFLSLENHPLIVPKRHIPNLYTLPDDLGAAIMGAAVRVANAVKASLGCDGIFVTQANEPAANQDVFHYHMHIYPRWFDHARSTQYTTQASEEDKRATMQQMVTALHAQQLHHSE